MEPKFLDFLKGLKESEYYKMIRIRVEQEIQSRKDALASAYPSTTDELRHLQGEIDGLQFDPVQQLLDESEEQREGA